METAFSETQMNSLAMKIGEQIAKAMRGMGSGFGSGDTSSHVGQRPQGMSQEAYLNHVASQTRQQASDAPLEKLAARIERAVQMKSASSSQTYEMGASGNLKAEDFGNMSGGAAKFSASIGLTIAALSKLPATVNSVIGPLRQMSAFFGAQPIDLQHAVAFVMQYNQSLLSLASSYAGLGSGFGAVESGLERIRKSTGLNYEETSRLMQTYASGFNFTSLASGEKLFNNLRRAVGSNSDALQAMLQSLHSVAEKFPDLEVHINRLNSSDKKFLMGQSTALLAAGKISMSDARAMNQYATGGAQASSADRARHGEVDKQVMDLKKIQQFFEDLVKQMGEHLQPLISYVSALVQKFAPWIDSIASVVTGLSLLAAGSTAVIGVLSLFYAAWKTVTTIAGFLGGMGEAANVSAIAMGRTELAANDLAAALNRAASAARSGGGRGGRGRNLKDEAEDDVEDDAEDVIDGDEGDVVGDAFRDVGGDVGDVGGVGEELNLAPIGSLESDPIGSLSSLTPAAEDLASDAIPAVLPTATSTGGAAVGEMGLGAAIAPVAAGFAVGGLANDWVASTYGPENNGQTADIYKDRGEVDDDSAREGSSALAGIGAGALIGTAILPGIGTVLGAIGGAIASGVETLSRESKSYEKYMSDLSASITKAADSAKAAAANQKALVDSYSKMADETEASAKEMAKHGDYAGAAAVRKQADLQHQSSQTAGKLAAAEAQQADIALQYKAKADAAQDNHHWYGRVAAIASAVPTLGTSLLNSDVRHAAEGQGDEMSQEILKKQDPEFAANMQRNKDLVENLKNKQAAEQQQMAAVGGTQVVKDVADEQFKKQEKLDTTDAQAQVGAMVAKGDYSGVFANIDSINKVMDKRSQGTAAVDTDYNVGKDASAFGFSDAEKAKLFNNGDTKHVNMSDEARNIVSDKQASLHTEIADTDTEINKAKETAKNNNPDKKPENDPAVQKLQAQKDALTDLSAQADKYGDAQDAQMGPELAQRAKIIEAYNQQVVAVKAAVDAQKELTDAQAAVSAAKVTQMQLSGNVDPAKAQDAITAQLQGLNTSVVKKQQLLDMQKAGAKSATDAEKEAIVKDKATISANKDPEAVKAATADINQQQLGIDTSDLAIAASQAQQDADIADLANKRVEAALQLTHLQDGMLAKLAAEASLLAQQTQFADATGASAIDGAANREQREAKVSEQIAQQEAKIKSFANTKAALVKTAANQKDLEEGTVKITEQETEANSALLTLHQEQLAIKQSYTDLNKQNVEMAQAEATQAEALVGLADSVGMGVKSSAEMRWKAVEAIGKEKDLQSENLGVLKEQEAQSKAQLVVAQKGQDTTKIEEARGLYNEMHTQRVKKETEILQLQQRQNEATRAMRDNYVSAIAAMSSGAGVFNKIVVDQSKNFGSFLANTKGATQSRTTGGIGMNGQIAGQDASSKMSLDAQGNMNVTGPDNDDYNKIYNAGGALGSETYKLQQGIRDDMRSGNIGGINAKMSKLNDKTRSMASAAAQANPNIAGMVAANGAAPSGENVNSGDQSGAATPNNPNTPAAGTVAANGAAPSGENVNSGDQKQLGIDTSDLAIAASQAQLHADIADLANKRVEAALQLTHLQGGAATPNNPNTPAAGTEAVQTSVDHPVEKKAENMLDVVVAIRDLVAKLVGGQSVVGSGGSGGPSSAVPTTAAAAAANTSTAPAATTVAATSAPLSAAVKTTADAASKVAAPPSVAVASIAANSPQKHKGDVAAGQTNVGKYGEDANEDAISQEDMDAYVKADDDKRAGDTTTHNNMGAKIQHNPKTPGGVRGNGDRIKAGMTRAQQLTIRHRRAARAAAASHAAVASKAHALPAGSSPDALKALYASHDMKYDPNDHNVSGEDSLLAAYKANPQITHEPISVKGKASLPALYASHGMTYHGNDAAGTPAAAAANVPTTAAAAATTANSPQKDKGDVAAGTSPHAVAASPQSVAASPVAGPDSDPLFTASAPLFTAADFSAVLHQGDPQPPTPPPDPNAPMSENDPRYKAFQARINAKNNQGELNGQLRKETRIQAIPPNSLNGLLAAGDSSKEQGQTGQMLGAQFKQLAALNDTNDTSGKANDAKGGELHISIHGLDDLSKLAEHIGNKVKEAIKNKAGNLSNADVLRVAMGQFNGSSMTAPRSMTV